MTPTYTESVKTYKVLIRNTKGDIIFEARKRVWTGMGFLAKLIAECFDDAVKKHKSSVNNIVSVFSEVPEEHNKVEQSLDSYNFKKDIEKAIDSFISREALNRDMEEYYNDEFKNFM